MTPSAEERVEERVCCPENGDPEPFWGMVFQIHAEELVSDAYHDGATAERAAIVAMLRSLGGTAERRLAWCIAANAIEYGEHHKPEPAQRGVSVSRETPTPPDPAAEA
jgi:hypothetical protein